MSEFIKALNKDDLFGNRRAVSAGVEEHHQLLDDLILKLRLLLDSYQ
jgi:hypothetical protein